MLFSPSSRRRWLQTAGALSLLPVSSLPGLAQAPKTTKTPITIAQMVDMAPDQQDISRDFLVGARAAWQDINQHGGIQGRPVQHTTLELDGSAKALADAWKSVRDNAACVTVMGTTGDRMAGELDALMKRDGAENTASALPHVAPWIQNSSAEVSPNTFPIFAGRQEQIAHSVKSLSVVGISEIGAVYATPRDLSLYRADVERSAASMKLGLRTVLPGAAMPRNLPAIVLFVGGTPELLQFCRGMEKQASGRQQFVVAMGDVNVQNLAQAGIPRSTPVIAAQPVPVVSASLPLVRTYRETLSRLFDEAPTPHSLAGFISARYTAQVLGSVDGALTRQSALAAFLKRADVDLGGYRVSYNAQRRGSSYVTQSMLSTDGRLLG